MKIAITAASGQLGAHIVKAMLKLTSSENVIGLAKMPERASHLGIEIRPGDYNDRDTLEHLLQCIDVILPVSGMDALDKRIGQHRDEPPRVSCRLGGVSLRRC